MEEFISSHNDEEPELPITLGEIKRSNIVEWIKENKANNRRLCIDLIENWNKNNDLNPIELELVDSSRQSPDLVEIYQGREGDCWLLAGMIAIAGRDKNILKDLIEPNDGGGYTVTVFTENLEKKEVSVAAEDISNVQDREGRCGFKSNPTLTVSMEDWPIILEAAYTKADAHKKGRGRRGGSSGLSGAKDISTGLRRLTGSEKIEKIKIAKGITNLIEAKIADGYAVTIGNATTNAGSSLLGHLYRGARRMASSGKKTPEGARAEIVKREKYMMQVAGERQPMLQSNHAYAVIKAADNELVISNPHYSLMEIRMPEDDVIKFFTHAACVKHQGA